MTEKQWRECLGELVHDYMRSPETDEYFPMGRRIFWRATPCAARASRWRKKRFRYRRMA